MKTCPVCGAKDTLTKGFSVYTAKYVNAQVSNTLEYYKCSCCDAELSLDCKEKNEAAIKNALETARMNSVAETIKQLEESISLVEIERSFSLPPKTLSKWKTKSKSPSAAAAAFISLLGVFPWLTYVGMCGYNVIQSYKMAGIAFFKEMAKNPNNYPFAMANENYSIIGVYNHKKEKKIKSDISPSCFGGNYVN